MRTNTAADAAPSPPGRMQSSSAEPGGGQSPPARLSHAFSLARAELNYLEGTLDEGERRSDSLADFSDGSGSSHHGVRQLPLPPPPPSTRNDLLCGFDLAPKWARRGHFSPEAQRARARLGAWCDSEAAASWRDIAAIEQSPLRLEYPELVVDRARVPRRSVDAEGLQVTVRLPQTTIEHARLASVQLRCGSEETVAGLVDISLRQSAKLHRTALDEVGIEEGRYVFKVMGANNFMLHQNWRLLDYTSAADSKRRRVLLRLELVRLADSQMNDLAPLRSTTKSDVRLAQRCRRAAWGDFHRVSEFDRASAASAQEATWQAWQHDRAAVHMSAAAGRRWRCVVKRFVGCAGAGHDLEELEVELRLFDAGGTAETLFPTHGGVRTPRAPYSNITKWNPGHALDHHSCTDVSRIPAAARIVLTVYGARGKGDGKTEGAPCALAHIALPFATDDGFVRTGTFNFRLWPSETAQKAVAARTSAAAALAGAANDAAKVPAAAGPNGSGRHLLKKGATPGSCIASADVGRCLVGEHACDSGGVLTVRFEVEGLDSDLLVQVDDWHLGQAFYELEQPSDDESDDEEPRLTEAEQHMTFASSEELASAVQRARSRSASLAPATTRVEAPPSYDDAACGDFSPVGGGFRSASVGDFSVVTGVDVAGDSPEAGTRLSEEPLTRGSSLVDVVAGDRPTSRGSIRGSSLYGEIVDIAVDVEPPVAAAAEAPTPRLSRPNSLLNAGKWLQKSFSGQSFSGRRSSSASDAASSPRGGRPPLARPTSVPVPRGWRASLPDLPRRALATAESASKLSGAAFSAAGAATGAAKGAAGAAKGFLGRWVPGAAAAPDLRRASDVAAAALAETLGRMHELPRLRELRRRERDARTVDRLAARPPLAPPLSRDDLDALWRARNFACSSPTALPAFWLAVPRQDKHAVHEARLLLRKWHLGARRGLFSPRVRVALQLLWWQHSDAHVRAFACRVLDQLGDGDFGELLTQLVQALKIENHHDSALARLLIRRGASAPLRVGHRLFWLLRAEMATPHVCERYGVVVAAFLDVSSETFRRMLADQCHVDLLLHACARAVKAEPTKFLRFEAMKKCLCKVNDDLESRHGLLGGFTTPLSPTVVCHRIDVDKCAVLSSKKVPLFISLTHFDDDAGDYLLIYKEGDDLRQDQLALQLVRMLDALWRDHGLDLALEPYGCVATGRDAGFIEVVRDAKTTAEIQVEFGGGAIGAFNDTVVAGYLAAHNPAYRAYERARATFVATCAGYCVATFVLGIGDRHAGNIMVSKSGRLFHIDFGHFLGNFKSKFGVRRERSPFVFTPDMKHVMDYVSFDHREQRSVVAEIQQRQGQAQGAASPRLGFADFEQLCCRAYNVTRQHGSTIALLFALMIPAGMPELQTCDDISYLTDRLALQLSASEAANDFRAEIKNAMATTSRRIDNYIHNLRHA